MVLSRYPDVVRKLREEHERVFSADPDETMRLLREGDPHKLGELEYTEAVIYETLRLFPPGLAARAGGPEG
jgi:cytochrome P450